VRPTLVAIRHLEIEGHVFAHGAEVMPELLSNETVDKLLDDKRIADYPERRSLYRMLTTFSGCKEKEQLSDAELTELCLPE
jgi:hypothetical protein